MSEVTKKEWPASFQPTPLHSNMQEQIFDGVMHMDFEANELMTGDSFASFVPPVPPVPSYTDPSVVFCPSYSSASNCLTSC